MQTAQTIPSIIIGSLPTPAERDPVTIRRELVLAVDALAAVRVRKAEAAMGAQAARDVRTAAGRAAFQARQEERALAKAEAAAFEALVTAAPEDVEAAITSLAAVRIEHEKAVVMADERQTAIAQTAAQTIAEVNYDGALADEARLLRAVETWRALAAKHPLPPPAPITSEPGMTFAESVAAIHGFDSPRDMQRAQLLRSVPADVRATLEADEVSLERCLDTLASGDVNGAIGAAYAAHERSKKSERVA